MIVAITGHRPEDCISEDDVRTKIRTALDQSGVDVVINGLAAGVDLWSADEALGLGLRVWSARPWRGHRPRVGDEELYERVLVGSEKIINVDNSIHYSGPWVYHNRNKWMVDHCDEMLTYYNGKQSGGTFQCLQYATKQKRPITNVI